MKIEEAIGAGFDQKIISQVRSWGIQSLTEVQQMAIKSGVANGCNLIVSAPTSSGKTLVGEIAAFSGLRSSKRILYLVSHKALADQKYVDFNKKFGEEAQIQIATVGLSTGDRDEGDHHPHLLIATYEKALGLLLSGELNTKDLVVIADELQIIGDPNRGPNIEALCTLLRQRGLWQFVALTATVENPGELAHWLGCDLVISKHRDVALHQEIWHNGHGHSIKFGDSEGVDLTSSLPFPEDVLDAVGLLIKTDRTPVLIFTETKKEAMEYAKAHSKKCVRAADGIAIAAQLELFSEPTESSEHLKEITERKVAFHTADLTPQERQVIEQGFIDSKFEVCFATSTLAAGVNFPFKSVLFPKLTFQYGTRRGNQIPKGEYRNMSGRAGRLGMHELGYAILLPKNGIELTYSNELVLPQNESVNSQLVSLSMKRSVLMLISSGIVDKKESAREFFEQTFFWHQIKEHTPSKLVGILQLCDEAIDWLLTEKMIEQHGTHLISTPLGKAASNSGLLPSTAAQFAKLIFAKQKDIEADFDSFLPAFLYWACSCDEFQNESPSRFLPYPTKFNDSMNFWASQRLLQPLDRTNTQLAQAAHALILYVQGMDERKISFTTKISAGGLHRLAIDINWVLDGLHRITSLPELKCSQQVANRLSMLSRRVKWGAPAEVLDIIRVADRHGVPGFGRQRAMALMQNGLSTFEDIIGSSKDKLLEILRNTQRTDSLLLALANSIGGSANRYEKTHLRLAKDLGLEKIVTTFNEAFGTDYEKALLELLRVEGSWTVTVLDDGKRQNVPDILIVFGSLQILLECKTCIKNPPLIKKDEAFAVLQKASDFDSKMRRVTLGKPGFDEHSKIKAQGSPDITLIEHSVFLEGILRVHSGSITAEHFLEWLIAPGLAEMRRLEGKPTYTIS